MSSFMHIKAGDTVIRLLAGTVPMKLKVERVDDTLIYCYGGWMFDRKTGTEEDPDLEWGVKFGYTGSVLTEEQ